MLLGTSLRACRSASLSPVLNWPAALLCPLDSLANPPYLVVQVLLPYWAGAYILTLASALAQVGDGYYMHPLASSHRRCASMLGHDKACATLPFAEHVPQACAT